MSIRADFDNIQELETSLRALVLFKFGGSSDADVFVGSPVMANAMTDMLRSIEAYWISADERKRAEGWRDLYRLSNARRHVGLISAYAPRHPNWSALSRAERVEWLTVLAAPYRLDEASLSSFSSLLGD